MRSSPLKIRDEEDGDGARRLNPLIRGKKTDPK